MFSIIGTQARRLPGASQFLWKQIGLVAIALIVAGILALGAQTLYSSLTGGESATSAVPVGVPSISGGNTQPSGNAASVPATIPIHVEWKEAVNPILPPVEEGFYNGTDQNVQGGASSTREGTAAARKIFPEFRDLPEGTAILFVAARDFKNKDIVLASATAFLGSDEPRKLYERGELLTTKLPPIILEARLALSVDGEKSWLPINLPPTSSAGILRVQMRGNSIHLWVLDDTAKIVWREAIVAP